MENKRDHTRIRRAGGATLTDALFRQAQGWIEFRFLKRGCPVRRTWTSPQEPEPPETIKLNGEGYNVYFGVCTRKKPGVGSAEDVLEMPGAWVDLDGKDFDEGDPFRGKQMALERLKNLVGSGRVPAPSIIVDSGHGWHVYWLYESPTVIADRAAFFTAVNIGLKDALGGDHVQDLARLMRLPGTVNHKDAALPIVCEVVFFDAGRRYRPEDFAGLAEACLRPQAAASRETQVTTPLAKSGDLRTLRPWVQCLVRVGHTPGCRYRSRSEAEFAVLGSMRKAGWAFSEVIGTLCRSDCAIGERFREQVEQRGFDKAVAGLRRGYEKLQEP